MGKKKFIEIFGLLTASLLVRFILLNFVSDNYPTYIRIIVVVFILGFGAFFILLGSAKIIEETTGILSERTKLAGGLLQSLGTAFPDMILGIVAALLSLRVRETDYALAVNYAIIAAATTFGSNIYNIGHAIWCLYRQNKADVLDKPLQMFPFFKNGGNLTPLKNHTLRPSAPELDIAIAVTSALSLLTAFVALGMVLFGQVTSMPGNFNGDLYQLIRPIGIVILFGCAFVLFTYRKSRRYEGAHDLEEPNFYRSKSATVIWISLIFAGISILFTAEGMVHALQVLSEIGHIPFVLTGVLAGIVGCLGEMIVIHNFSIHPTGRLGDAVVGVAMDNIVTISGASIVAIVGGIFLGGRDLIIIFVIILALNTVLMEQISKMKTRLFLLDSRNGN